jgi:hypothetical protein
MITYLTSMEEHWSSRQYFSLTPGREASTEYEPCWPGKGFSSLQTELVFIQYSCDVFRVGHPAAVMCSVLVILQL